MTRLLTVLALLFITSLPQFTRAAPAPNLDAFDLPDVDRTELTEDIDTLRSRLIARKQELLREVAARKPDGEDALISIILPGGLLYAAYTQARYSEAQHELDRVSAEIRELSADLVALQADTTPVFIAQLP
jgi:hypothetical protein